VVAAVLIDVRDGFCCAVDDFNSHTEQCQKFMVQFDEEV
jgi:hypothetical protein